MKNTLENTESLLRAYMASFEHLPYGVGVVKNDPYSTLILANPAYYTLLGHTKEQLSQYHQNRITDVLVDNVYNIIEMQSMNNNFNVEFDLRIRAADGEIRWVHDFAHYNAELDLFFITLTNITDKMVTATVHLSFEAFQVRNAVLSYVSKYSTEHILVTDATGKVVYMNPSAMKLAGLSDESEWQGRSYIEIAFGSAEHIPPEFYAPVTEEFSSREYYNEHHKLYLHVEDKLLAIPNLHQTMRLTIVSDITTQKQLEHKIGVQTVLHNCIETLFTAGVSDKTPDEAYYDILDQLKTYYRSAVTFFYRFKTGSYEVDNFYEVFAEGVKVVEHSLPIVLPQAQIDLLQKLSETNITEYQALLTSLDEVSAAGLKHLHRAYDMKAFSCVSVYNNAGKIVAFMGLINPELHDTDKELMQLLSRFLCMFIEHQQDQEIKDEALALEATSKKNLVEKCAQSLQNLTAAEEGIPDILDSLCAHYDADFSVVLLEQSDGSCVTSYVGGDNIPDLTGMDHQPSGVMQQWVEVFGNHPEFVSDIDFSDPTGAMVKQLLLQKFGIYNFIVSPIKDSTGKINGLLFLNNFKLLNRARLMVQIVAENISNYLWKIKLYETTQLGLLTRLASKTTTQSQISALLQEGKGGALFVIDIDNFKRLNNTVGQHAGDQAIVDLATSLKQIFVPTDILGRIGGDEFMVFAPGLIAEDTIAEKANQILAETYHHYEKDGVAIEVSTSIGIALVGEKCKSFQPLFDNADYALYTAKRGGKHRFRIYRDADYLEDTSVADEMRFFPNVLEKLQSSIHDRSFVVHYQPLYHLPTGKFTQAEALVRMRKTDGSLIYPVDFIQVAESTGLAVEMTYQILEQVCHDFWLLHQNQPDSPMQSIAINVPYLQFTDPNMEHRFLSILQKYDVAPSQIKLEITERSIVKDMDLMLRKMENLMKQGFLFELDDFGTDYSNLQMCISLPIESIKLDHSLLLAAFASPTGRHFFEHIVAGIHATERTTVMEGVETLEQLEWASARNCEYIQGYYFSKPLDFENFCQFLKA